MDEYIPVDLDLSGPDGNEGATDGEGQAVAASGVEQGQADQVQPVTDWEAEQNPYKARYTGLQGNFKQVQTERQQAAQQLAQLQEELAVQQAVSQGATEEEVKAVRKNWDDQKQVTQFMEAMATEVGRVEQLKQSLQPVARQLGIAFLAKQHGIKTEDLADALTDADGPETAKAVAKMLQRQQKVQVLTDRKVTGADRVESGGGGQADLSKLSSLEKIRYGIEQAKTRR